ncbi:MAG: bifunctional precorrin-2 dehydrogenase/sirohydrochlorin ferrochelatase [Halobacteriales archaeon]
MIPLFHDFAGERVLVFGGGGVGARKSRRFAREAEVLVVGPEFGDREFGGATLLRGAPDPAEVGEWIDRINPALVVAATDDGAVNAAVEEATRERGILVNRADRSGERDPGSVVVPATARDDPVVVAIATGGQAPVLSGFLREDVETLIEGTGALADLLGELRGELDEHGVGSRHRRQALRAVVESEAVRDALNEADRETAREEAVAVIEKTTA